MLKFCVPKNLPPKSALLDKRYLLEKKLGEGGSSKVFLAQDQKMAGKKVALKIALHKISDSVSASILKNEFRQLTQLHHPNLAQVYDCGVFKEKFYFSEEWIEGKNILEFCKNVNLNTVFDLIIQSLRALHYIHSQGILHLDLKPENLLIQVASSSGKPTLQMIDFGLSQNLKAAFDQKDFSGTPPYTAPELILGKQADIRSDLYSFGVICYQILTETLPFSGSKPQEWLSSQLYQEAIPPQFKDLAIPESFEKILLKLLSKNPTDRPCSALEALEQINHCLSENFSIYPADESLFDLKSVPYLLHKKTFSRLHKLISESGFFSILLQGKKGIGKSHLLLALKQKLQLENKKIVLIQDRKLLNDFIFHKDHSSQILFVDFQDSKKDDFKLINTVLQKRIPLLWSSNSENKSIQNLFKKSLVLEKITSKCLEDFFRATFAHSLGNKESKLLLKSIRGLPAQLEIYLQTLCQKGFLNWTPSGWRTSDREIPSPHKIFGEYSKSIKEISKKAKKLIQLSPSGISITLLASLLNTPRTFLSLQLKNLVKKNILIERKNNQEDIFFLVPSKSKSSKKIMKTNFATINQQLESLYTETDYILAQNLIETILGNHSLDKIPPPTLLVIARNMIVLGKFTEALKIFPLQEPKEKKLQGLYHELKAKISFQQKDFKKCLQHLLIGIEKFKTTKDTEGVSRILNLESLILKMQGNTEAAEQKFTEAIHCAQQSGNTYIQGVYWMNFATLFHDLGNYRKASEYYHKASQLSLKSKSPHLSCILFHNLANLSYQLGKSNEVEKICFKWLEMALEHHYKDQQAAALNYLALLEGERNNLSKKIEYLNQAILLSDDHPNLQIQSIQNRAHTQLESRNFFAALLDCQSSLEMSEKVQDPAFLSRAHLILGKVLRDQSKWDFKTSSFHLERALQIAKQASLENILWEIELEIALLFLKQKDISKSKEHILLSQSLLERLAEKIPEEFSKSFWRDRKDERIFDAFNQLNSLKERL